jgi:hypothetical protein
LHGLILVRASQRKADFECYVNPRGAPATLIAQERYVFLFAVRPDWSETLDRSLAIMTRRMPANSRNAPHDVAAWRDVKVSK